MPFAVATRLVNQSSALSSFTWDAVRDPAVLAMADRVSYRADPSAVKGKGGSSAASIGKTTVEVRTADGRILTATPASVPGDPKSPINQELLEAKFRDCVSFSAQPVSAANVDQAIAMIADLENVADATDIIRLLSR